MLSSEDIPKQLRGPRSFVETRADGVHVAHNLPYQVEADKYVPHKHDLDVFVPAETNTDFRTPRPVVIFVHGGGWKKGDRKYFLGLYSNVGVSFASRGFVTVLPSYRLSKVPFYLTALLSLLHAAIISAIIGLLAWSLTVALAAYLPVYIVLNLIHWYIRPRTPVKHPEHAQDVASAVKWVMTNIEHFGGDPSSIFLSGHSAGGHLVSLVALDPKYLDDIGVGHLRASIKGVIGISGVYVLNPMLQSWVARPLYLLPAFGSDTSVWPDAFPARWVSAQAPPFQLFNATKDWGLEEHTALFAAELTKFGIPNEQHVIPNTNHLSIIRSVGKKHDEITDRAVLFMRSLYNK